MNQELLRAFLTMMACISVIGGLLWFVKRKMSRASIKGGSTILLSVVARQSLTPKSHVCILAIGSSTIVLGVTDTTISVIGEIQKDGTIQYHSAQTTLSTQAIQHTVHSPHTPPQQHVPQYPSPVESHGSSHGLFEQQVSHNLRSKQQIHSNVPIAPLSPAQTDISFLGYVRSFFTTTK